MDHVHEIRSRKETFAVTSNLYLIMEKFGFINLHSLLTESSYNVVMLPGLVCLRWKLGLLFRQFVVNILPLSNMNLMMTQIQNHSTDWMEMHMQKPVQMHVHMETKMGAEMTTAVLVHGLMQHTSVTARVGRRL